jgi:hypothetical protein
MAAPKTVRKVLRLDVVTESWHRLYRINNRAMTEVVVLRPHFWKHAALWRKVIV